jgi:hypothetical protein
LLIPGQKKKKKKKKTKKKKPKKQKTQQNQKKKKKKNPCTSHCDLILDMLTPKEGVSEPFPHEPLGLYYTITM